MLVTVATYSFPHEAHIAKGQLEAVDIPAFVADEHTINMQWLYSNAMGGVRLQVPEEFAAQAIEVLKEPVEMEHIPDSEFGPEPESAVCPHCGGELGEPYMAGRYPALVGLLFLGLPLWRIKKVQKCLSCGKTTKAV
ncbi:MAG: DUF2007 domain-containing protein [Nevskiaceae bacterium]|jgi:hypothetical protein|nr:DUF2007 domain-containing protein [Nevskiaceae bacterium]